LSRPIAAIVGGVSISNTVSASYCAIFEISNWSARSPLTTVRPWRLSQASTAPVYSAA